MLYESNYYGVCDLGDSLAHHGIKGQKWGVKNGPPYPLKPGAKSKREKAAANKSGSSVGNSTGEHKQNGRLNASTILKNSAGKKTKEIGVIDPGTAYLLTEAALTVTLALAVRHIQKKQVKEEAEMNKSDSGNIQKKIKGKHTETQDMTAINPGYKENKPGSFMNCTMCTTAYELRRRGYDVMAQPSKFGRLESDVLSWYNVDKKEMKTYRKYADVNNALNDQPDGARGNIITGVGDFDSKHSMIWEKKNGRVIIRDAQSDTTYDSVRESIIRERTQHGYTILRTDNAEINWDNIRDAVRERKG